MTKYFKSIHLSRKTKVILCVAKIRQTLKFCCEACTINQTERRLTAFENKVWRRIYLYIRLYLGWSNQ